MRLWELEAALQQVSGFQRPNVTLEQYVTPPHIAACILHTAQTSFGDVEDAIVADLGCGTGALSIAAALVGARAVYSYDVDPEALETASENLSTADLTDRVHLFKCDVLDTNSHATPWRSSAAEKSGDESSSSDDSAPEDEDVTSDADVDSESSGNGEKVAATTGPDVDHLVAGTEAISGRRTVDIVVCNPPFGTKNNRGADVGFLKRAMHMARTAVYSLHKSSTRSHILSVATSAGGSATVVAALRYNLPATYKFHRHAEVDIEVDLIRVDVSHVNADA